MNAKTYDNSEKGVLFVNEQKTELAEEKDTTKWADYKGSAEVDGVEYWVSGWRKEVKTGKHAGEKMLSLAFTKKEEKGERNEPKHNPNAKVEGGDPF